MPDLLLNLTKRTQEQRADAWFDDAWCKVPDPGMSAAAHTERWYPERGYQTDCFQVCYHCPVWFECLTYGLTDLWGVYGGLRVSDKRLLRQRLGDLAAIDPAVLRREAERLRDHRMAEELEAVERDAAPLMADWDLEPVTGVLGVMDGQLRLFT